MSDINIFNEYGHLINIQEAALILIMPLKEIAIVNFLSIRPEQLYSPFGKGISQVAMLTG